jgi:molybdate transport system ATP-binding protein
MTEPQLLLLDEPSRGLDLHLRAAFWELLLQLRRRVAIPILLVTHDIEECCGLAEHIVILDQGRLLQSGSRDEVIRRPASVEAAKLLGLHNIAPAEISMLDPAAKKSRLRVFDQEIEGPHLPGHLIGDTGFLCILQSEMRVVEQRRNSGVNALKLKIEGARRSAAGVRLELEHGLVATLSEADYARYGNSASLAFSAPVEAMAFTGR